MKLSLLRFSPWLCILLILAGTASLSRGQDVESGYGPLTGSEFHSGFWVNLHRFLYLSGQLQAGDHRGAIGSELDPKLEEGDTSASDPQH